MCTFEGSWFLFQAVVQAVTYGYHSPSPPELGPRDVELLEVGTGNWSLYNWTVMPTESATMTEHHQAVIQAKEHCFSTLLSKPYPSDGKKIFLRSSFSFPVGDASCINLFFGAMTSVQSKLMCVVFYLALFVSCFWNFILTEIGARLPECIGKAKQSVDQLPLPNGRDIIKRKLTSNTHCISKQEII